MVVMYGITDSLTSMTLGEREQSVVTFAQALRDKYVNQEEFDNRLVVPKDKIISTDITFVGFGTVTCVQKQLKRLTSIDLSDKQIETAGEFDDLAGSLDRVQILNLAENRLSWKEITSVLQHLPRLKELVLTGNCLVIDDTASIQHNLPNSKLTYLTMGRLYLDWKSIIRIISHIWLQVEQLDLWDNHLCADTMVLDSSSDRSISFVQQILSLKLSKNFFPDLKWISQIGPLDNLFELDISKCQLKAIDLNVDIVQQLSNLQTLNISYNDLDDWRSIANLYHLQRLTNLICHENPIFISEKYAKPLTIGRLGNLKTLNREEVTRNVRRDSEILYLRMTFADYQAFKENKNINFKENHPRYEDLAHLYGLPADLTKKQVIDKYITVDLYVDDKKMTKKLPCDMRIGNVKMLAKRLFKLKPSSNLLITCCEPSPTDNAISYVLDQDGQTLHFFSVKNGHRLIIQVDC